MKGYEVTGEAPLKEILGPTPSLCLSFLLLGRRELSSFTLPFTVCHDILPHHERSVTRPSSYTLTPLKALGERKISSF